MKGDVKRETSTNLAAVEKFLDSQPLCFSLELDCLVHSTASIAHHSTARFVPIYFQATSPLLLPTMVLFETLGLQLSPVRHGPQPLWLLGLLLILILSLVPLHIELFNEMSSGLDHYLFSPTQAPCPCALCPIILS